MGERASAESNIGEHQKAMIVWTIGTQPFRPEV
jgi:hypothetical protein